MSSSPAPRAASGSTPATRSPQLDAPAIVAEQIRAMVRNLYPK
jgi:hypothetical protein